MIISIIIKNAAEYCSYRQIDFTAPQNRSPTVRPGGLIIIKYCKVDTYYIHVS